MNANWEPYREPGGTGRRALTLAAAVAALMVLLIGAFAIGRATGGVGRTVAGRPPAPGTSRARSSWAGPSGEVAGVPVGYARTSLGAVRAAAAYDVAMEGPLLLDASAQNSAVRAMAARSAVPSLLAAAASNRNGIQQELGVGTASSQGKHVLISAGILAYHIDQYDPDQAGVSLWATDVVGVEGGAPMLTVYALFPVTVVWEQGDWKLKAVGDPGAFQPVPGVRQTATNQGLPDQLQGFTPYAS